MFFLSDHPSGICLLPEGSLLKFPFEMVFSYCLSKNLFILLNKESKFKFTLRKCLCHFLTVLFSIVAIVYLHISPVSFLAVLICAFPDFLAYPC